MTAPLYGADIFDSLKALAADIAELRAENVRMKILLALHGVDVDEAEGWIEIIDRRLCDVEGISHTATSDTASFRDRLRCIEWAFEQAGKP